jgi:GH25 family lysozyme M1 (1,4-beta-N-acetylmuramidase)
MGKNIRRKPMTKDIEKIIAWSLVVAAVLSLLVVVAALFPKVAAPKPKPTETAPQTVGTRPTEPRPTLVPNPYTAEDLVLSEDGFMELLGGPSVIGIDVSYYQKDIDWIQVRDAGIEFVIVRLGYRGYESGSLFADEKVYQNLYGAKEAGLRVGAYFYSQAITPQEAAEEAAFALEILDGFRLDMPVVFDWEFVSGSAARTDNMDAITLTKCTVAFCEAIRAGGYNAMVYFNPYMAENFLNLLELQDLGYPFWLAHYTDTMTFPHKVQIWQYSYTGQVPGIPGNVDLNIMLP